MILRTTPQRKRRAESSPLHQESPVSDRRLVVCNNDSLQVSSIEPSDDLVCSHQWPQMVKSEFMVDFNTAEKQVAEFLSKVETLSNELRKSDAGKLIDADIPEKLAQLNGQIAILEKRE